MKNTPIKVSWSHPGSTVSETLEASFVYLIKIDDPLLHELDGFILANFIGDHIYLFSHVEQEQLKEVAFSMSVDPTKDTSKLQYLENVKEAITRFKTGNLEKVVVARQSTYPSPSKSIDEAYATLLKAYPDAFVYMIEIGNAGLLGASPEELVNVTTSDISTVALAGTRLIAQEEPFYQKEYEEQKFVQDYIEEKAIKDGLPLIFKSEVYEKTAGNLKHLCSDYQFSNIGKVGSFIQNLHPTPAVAGTPTKEAIDFIQELETFERGFYAGFLGEWSSKTKKLFVNLRCGYMGQSGLTLWSGAGISEGSDAAKEWEETNHKQHTLLQVLNPNLTL